MAIVKLSKIRDQKVSELLNMYRLPCVSSRGYEVIPGPETLVGGSAITDVEATRIHAVNQLRKWIKPG